MRFETDVAEIVPSVINVNENGDAKESNHCPGDGNQSESRVVFLQINSGKIIMSPWIMIIALKDACQLKTVSSYFIDWAFSTLHFKQLNQKYFVLTNPET